MKNLALVCCLFAVVACASSRQKDDEPLVGAPLGVPSVDSDARLAQMQTSMTEMLERLDVINDRIAKLEAGIVAPAPAAHEVRTAAPAAVSPLATESRAAAVAAEPPAAREPQIAVPGGALAGARIAENYRGALMLVGQGKLLGARKAFQQVFDAEPTGDLADNALFWIGETYFTAGDYATAMRYYRRVTTEFAEQNKAPDALLKMALSYEKTSDLALARKTLEEVIQRYPYSSPAASAKYELKRIKY
jgi:tol-pal system protein YbgF